MNRAETIKESKERWERKESDFYPTPFEVTFSLIDWMRAAGLINRKVTFKVLEPCCGEGHISRVLLGEEFDVTSHDIRHTGYGEGGVDYLVKPEKDATRYEFDAVITNPPWSVADRFIHRALRDAPVVAMLLPTDFWHASGRTRFFRSRPPRAVLALTWRPAFLASERGENPLANVCWTVWDSRGNHGTNTQYDLLPRPVI